MATKKDRKRAKAMPKASMKATKGGAWYAKFDGVDGSVQERSSDLPLEQVSFNYSK